MVESAVEVIASNGILGAICVILGLACWRLYSQLQDAHNSRVEDAQKVAETLLKLNDQWSNTVSELSMAVKELKVVVEAMRSQR